MNYRGKSNQSHRFSLLYIGLILIVLSVAFYLYFPGADFFGTFLLCLGGGLLLLFGLHNIPRVSALYGYTLVVRVILTIIIILWLISFCVLESIILFNTGATSDPEGADYLIVPGAGLNGSTPSLTLRSRLDGAVAYLERNPGTIIVVSGGMGTGETTTEAAAMKSYLVEHGVEGSRIIKEPAATSTTENLRLSFALLPPAQSGRWSPKVVVLSNEFHLYRIKLIAAKEGQPIQVLPASTPLLYLKMTYLTREYFAVIKVLLEYR